MRMNNKSTSEVEESGDHFGACPRRVFRLTSENGIPEGVSNAVSSRSEKNIGGGLVRFGAGYLQGLLLCQGRFSLWKDGKWREALPGL